jgi:hypothetical protein
VFLEDKNYAANLSKLRPTSSYLRYSESANCPTAAPRPLLPVLSISAQFVLRRFSKFEEGAMNLATSPNPAQHEHLPDNADLTVADAVWIATAVLQRKAEDSCTFSTETIVQSVVNLRLTKGAPKSIWQHVNQHCVANRKAQPNKVRMLTATGHGDRRLFRDRDRFDSERIDGRTHPDWDKLPEKYADLRQWYETVWNKPSEHTQVIDPLLELAGTGQGMWGTGSADDYVNSLRSGWEASH